jgi:hypothetical protein
MIRRGMTAVLAGLMLASLAPGQVPARLHWQAGQVLNYQVSHDTRATQVVEGRTFETKSQLQLTKSWRVLAVDKSGVATLQLSLTAMRMEVTGPSGEVMKFDSADAKGGTPEMREQLTKFIGSPLAVLRIDGQGKVVEVKESKGPAKRYESELPFGILLPADALRPGLSWDRAYEIKLEPPAGTGEKYAAVQKYACKGLVGGAAIVNVTTELKAPPTAAERIPLLEFQPEGEIVYDLQAGRLKSAVLKIDKELKGHQGEGSSYHFQSQYTEQFVGDR